jgi:hypothetical protein
MKINALDFSTPRMEVQLRRSMINKLRYFIERTDWDERILAGQKWLDGFCWGFIVLSIVFSLPTFCHLLH